MSTPQIDEHWKEWVKRESVATESAELSEVETLRAEIIKRDRRISELEHAISQARSRPTTDRRCPGFGQS